MVTIFRDNLALSRERMYRLIESKIIRIYKYAVHVHIKTKTKNKL